MAIWLRANQLFFLVLFSFFGIVSCDNHFGIFKTIQQEKKQLGSAIFKRTAVTKVFRFKDWYFAATSKLNRRSVIEGSYWHPIGVANTDNYTLNAVATTTSKLYAAVLINGSLLVYETEDCTNWISITLPSHTLSATQSSNIDELYTANDTLFAAFHIFDSSKSALNSPGTSSLYYLYYLQQNTLNNPIENFSPTPTMKVNNKDLNPSIGGVAWDGTKYIFASTYQLISSSGKNGANSIDMIPNYTDIVDIAGGAKSIWRLSRTENNVYITTTSGTLYQVGTAEGVQVSDRPLTAVLEVPDPSPFTLVGTDVNFYGVSATTKGAGYYEGSTWQNLASGDKGLITESSSVYATTFSGNPVFGFYYDSEYQILLACQATGINNSLFGLYSTKLNNSASSTTWRTYTVKPGAWSGWLAE